VTLNVHRFRIGPWTVLALKESGIRVPGQRQALAEALAVMFRT
jgi:hypothetical protein